MRKIPQYKRMTKAMIQGDSSVELVLPRAGTVNVRINRRMKND
jgi:hypothetical protein